jgi:hypothetical protein
MKITLLITPLAIQEPSANDLAKGIKSIVSILVEREKNSIKEQVVLSLKSKVLIDQKALNKPLLCEADYPKAVSLSQYQQPTIYWVITAVKQA